MRQLYLFWLTALALLGVSFNTQAADCTVEWNIPGAIELRDGLTTTAKVTPLEDQTSYSVAPSARPYFFATEGYLITKVENTAGQTLSVQTSSSTNEKYVGFFCNTNYQGNKVIITVVKLSDIVKDKSFTLDIENGASYLAEITLDGTDEKIELKNGPQTISYSSEITSSVRIAETNQNKIFSVKKDGTAVSKKYTWDSFFDVTLSDGATISVRVFEDQEPVSNILTGAFVFEGLGEEALSMVFNATALKTITARDQFEFNTNDQIRLTFNTKDYVIDSFSYNGTPVTINNDEERASWLSPALTENTTFTIKASEHEYGNTDLYVAIHGDLDGVILTEGGYDGKVIDLSALTPTEVTKGGDKYSLYTIPVSLKNPKIFWTSKEGYWIHEQNTVASDGEGGYVEAGSVSSSNCSITEPAYVYVHKINKDNNAVVYVKGDLTGFALRDARNNRYELTEGYNEILFDPVYSETFSIRPYLQSESDKFSAYRNYSALSPDDNNVYNTSLTDGDVLHIFPRVETPAQYTITVTRDDRSSVITHDKIVKVDPTAKSFKVFDGTEVTVIPRSDSKFLLDGEAAASNTFTVSNAHAIALSYEGNLTDAVTDPEDGSTSESLDFVTVTFPNATSVVRSALADDEMMFVATGFTWAPASTTIEPVEGAEKPTFKISFTPAPSDMKQYILDIPAGFFIIDDDLDSKQITSNLTLKKNLSEMTYVIDPVGDTMVVSQWGPMFTVHFEDGIQPTVDAASIAEKVTIKFNDEKLEYDPTSAGGFIMMCEGNMLLAQVPGAANKVGTLTIEIAAGLFTAGGIESPAMSKTYQIIEDKEFSHTITTPKQVGSVHGSLAEIIIEFPEAETASIIDEFNTATVLTNGSYGNDQYLKNGVIEEIVETPQTRATTGKQFKIKFDPAPTANGEYTLTIRQNAFLLDGNYYSAPIEEKLVLDTSVGVIEIGSENIENAIVVSIDGKILSTNANKLFIDNLDKGIYIINGKKYIKK